MEIEVFSQEQLDATRLVFRSLYVPEIIIEDDFLLGWFLQMYRYFLIITSNVTKTKLEERMENVGHNAQYLLDYVIFREHKRIAAGRKYTLALTADGRVIGWGKDYEGQINIPNDLPRIVSIAAASTNSLALTADGKMIAWGDNLYGQRNVPNNLPRIVSIAAASTNSLALTSDGKVVAWGANHHGQLNVPPELHM